MIIDCISDLHGYCPELEGGDLLIVAGDLMARDKADEYGDDFQPWLDAQNYKCKIVVAGNHDNLLQKGLTVYRGFDQEGHFADAVNLSYIRNCVYLCDSGTEWEYHDPKFPLEDEGFLPSGKRTLKIWGSPWTLRFEGMNPLCMAFTVDTEEELAEKWALMPKDVDILVTHLPPYGYLDEVNGKSCGSHSLLKKCYGTGGIFPSVHIFGHIHEQGGKMTEIGGCLWPSPHPSIFINASHVNERYEPVNKPIRIEL